MRLFKDSTKVKKKCNMIFMILGSGGNASQEKIIMDEKGRICTAIF
jgi:hypothetical protein